MDPASPMVNDLVKEVMLRSLSTEVREKLLQNAIAAIVEPTRGAYGNPGPSPLSEAFTDAARRVVQDEARRMLEADPVAIAALKALVEKAVKKFLDTSGVEALAETVVRSMRDRFDKARDL